ncbi:MAG: AzlD domain-containing protein [Burkholderiales bacterium]|nr:AzlD domain-containing protein [Burkholderiales bacterium]
MDPLTAWLLIGLLAATSFGTRASFILWLHRIVLPAYVQRGLRFVPAAVFTALVAPEIAMAGGAPAWGLGDPKPIAAVAAILVAARTRSTLATILAGMLVLYAARAILAA